MSWQMEIIRENCNKLKATELYKFMIAYAALPPEYHGYLTEYPQNSKVFTASIAEEDKKLLENEFDIYTTQNGVFYKGFIPFLGIDGCLKLADDEHKKHDAKMDITTNISQLAGTSYVHCTIVSGLYGTRMSIAEVKKAPSDFQSGLEIATSNSIRKVLGYLGYGRFPFEKTAYGEHDIVLKFREFAKNAK